MTTIFYELIKHLDELENKIATNIEESELLQREVIKLKEELSEAENKVKKEKRSNNG